MFYRVICVIDGPSGIEKNNQQAEFTPNRYGGGPLKGALVYYHDLHNILIIRRRLHVTRNNVTPFGVFVG